MGYTWWTCASVVLHQSYAYRAVDHVKSVQQYNRLRAKYRSDLPSLPLIQRKHESYMVRVLYIQDDIPQNIKKPDKLQTSLVSQHTLFINNDRVSGYTNSIAQLLLHIEQFRNILYMHNCHNVANTPVTNELQKLMNSTNSRSGPLNVLPLR